MPYIYADVDNLQNTDKVGSKHCVALIQHYTDAPNTRDWSEGQVVMGSSGLAKGTAIATFVAGRYPNHSSGNHAAFLLSVESNGIWVMDQWKDDASKPKVSKRFLRKKGKDKNGKFIDPSNNADAYSVIN
ncbi:BPSL0067 family protein [Massilia sp. W12]|uniref:BPSL0067 family protein n=1 Tax=Massilia sp. W12 TaxID=3126507 RepID=UPI0030CEF6DA